MPFGSCQSKFAAAAIESYRAGGGRPSNAGSTQGKSFAQNSLGEERPDPNCWKYIICRPKLMPSYFHKYDLNNLN